MRLQCARSIHGGNRHGPGSGEEPFGMKNGSTARIGVMRALNRGHVREFDSTRKETRWGKRKLKRDQ
jgi:hypothetical protein